MKNKILLVVIVLILLLLLLASCIVIWLLLRNSSNTNEESDNGNIAVSTDFEKWDLWNSGTMLRGANIYQWRIYEELDDGSMGDATVGTPYIQSDFDELAKLGANVVNISHPGLFKEMLPYKIDSDVEENLDDLLSMISKADMFAIISFRTGPGRSGFTFFGDEDWFDESYRNDEVWENNDAQDAWVEMWEYTAARYKNNPIVVGYTLMVEPNAADALLDVYDPEEFYSEYEGSFYDWNQLYPRIVKGIRSVDSSTPIIVGGMSYSSVEWFDYLEMSSDSRIVYEVHQYAPVAYTHQESESSEYTYPGSFDTNWDGIDNSFNRGWLEELLSSVSEFKQTEKVPVFIGEFGVTRWAGGADDFLDDQIELFETDGLNYSIWMWHSSFHKENRLSDNEFNFLFGTDAENTKEDTSSELLKVIKKYWESNEVRPSKME
jgi:hypothetical protein